MNPLTARRARFAAVALSLAAMPLSSAIAGGSPVFTAYDHLPIVDQESLAASGRYVWIGDAGFFGDAAKPADVVRVDAATGTARVISSPLITRPIGLDASGPYVWVVNGLEYRHAPSLVRIDVATSAVTRVASLPGQVDVVSMAVAGGSLWIAGVKAQALVRVNTATLVTSTFTSSLFAVPQAVTGDRRYLWVSNNVGGPLRRGAVDRITLATGAVREVDSKVFNDGVAMADDGSHVWVGASEGDAARIDIATLTVTKVVSRSFFVDLSVTTSGHDAYFADTGGQPSGGAITRVNGDTGATSYWTSPLLKSPWLIAALNGQLWVLSAPSPPLPGATRPPSPILVRVTL